MEEKETWDKTYTMVAEALHYYDHLANPIGIYRHPDKGKLLLPPSAPDPRVGHPILSVTKVCRGAARVAGGYAGPDVEAEQLVLAKIDTAVRKMHAIVRMAAVILSRRPRSWRSRPHTHWTTYGVSHPQGLRRKPVLVSKQLLP